MDKIKLSAHYRVGLEEKGRKTMQSLDLEAEAGECIYLYGNTGRRQAHFQLLAGQRRPEDGNVTLGQRQFYTQSGLVSYRRDHIGVLPQNGGLLPEIPMLEQITLPMKLAGWPKEHRGERLRELTGDSLPLHDLYNRPGRCSQRKQAIAAIIRAVVMKPQVLLVNGFLDEFEALDAQVLWDTLETLRPPHSVLLYFSGAPAPDFLPWTQKRML